MKPLAIVGATCLGGFVGFWVGVLTCPRGALSEEAIGTGLAGCALGALAGAGASAVVLA